MPEETTRPRLEPGQDSRSRSLLLRLGLRLGLGLGLLLVLVLLALTGACALPKAELLILHLNDYHGQIQPKKVQRLPGNPPVRMGGFATLQAYLAKARRDHALVWLTDGGDWFQGTPEGNEDFGLSVMACRRRLGLTAAVVGNHEYDFGEENLMRILEGVDHPVLGANILERGSSAESRPYVRPYLILPLGQLRVALVGLTAGDTEEVSTGPFGRASFADEVATLRRLWPELQERADEIVLLSHCGLEKDIQLAREFPELLLILGGHSHTALWRGHRVGRTWIVQAEGRGTCISRVLLRVVEEPGQGPGQGPGQEPGQGPGQGRLQVVSAGLVPLITEEVGEDASTLRFLDRQFAHIGRKWDQPLAQLAGARDRRGGPGSTPAGNYVAELIRRAGAAELGLTNKGGLRATLSQGAITRRMVLEFLPFDNTVVTLSMSGAQLKGVLAQGLRRGRQPLEIAGGSYGYRVVGGQRELAWLRVGGKPVTEERMYAVATNSFLARGGDGFTLFKGPRQGRSGTLYLRDLMLEDLARSGFLRLVEEARIQVVD